MIDLIEDYTWADEDCDLLTKTQIEYHKGVRFYRYSEGTKLCCPNKTYYYRFTFQLYSLL